MTLKIRKKLYVFQQSCSCRILCVRYCDKVTKWRNIVMEQAIQGWTYSEGVQDTSGRPHTMHTRPPPPQDGNELESGQREKEERQAMQMWCATFKKTYNWSGFSWMMLSQLWVAKGDRRWLLPNVQCMNGCNTHTHTLITAQLSLVWRNIGLKGMYVWCCLYLYTWLYVCIWLEIANTFWTLIGIRIKFKNLQFILYIPCKSICKKTKKKVCIMFKSSIERSKDWEVDKNTLLFNFLFCSLTFVHNWFITA